MKKYMLALMFIVGTQLRGSESVPKSQALALENNSNQITTSSSPSHQVPGLSQKDPILSPETEKFIQQLIKEEVQRIVSEKYIPVESATGMQIPANNFAKMPPQNVCYIYNKKHLENTNDLHKALQTLSITYEFEASSRSGIQTLIRKSIVHLDGLFSATEPFIQQGTAEEYAKSQQCSFSEGALDNIFKQHILYLQQLAENGLPFYKRHYWKAIASIGSSALILGIYLGIKLTMHYTRPVAA